MPADLDEIRNRFDYHQPSSMARVLEHGDIRGILKDAALELVQLVPEGREQALMLTKLEEAMFWANAGLARP